MRIKYSYRLTVNVLKAQGEEGQGMCLWDKEGRDRER